MIKYPGGEIAFWSILYTIAGALMAYMSFADGRPVLAVLFVTLPIGCTLIWFDIRVAKWLVAGYLSLATIAAIALFISNGFNTKNAIRTVITAYTAFQFATWDGGPGSQTQLDAEEEFVT